MVASGFKRAWTEPPARLIFVCGPFFFFFCARQAPLGTDREPDLAQADQDRPAGLPEAGWRARRPCSKAF